MNRLFLLFLFFSSIVVTPQAYGEPLEVRAGHFPNVTHAPALIARAKKHFETALAERAAVRWTIFYAGPEAVEALFANAMDILYVGPNPAVNGFVRSGGKALRIISGVASGGSAFVGRTASGIERLEDIRGKRLATPQHGNSQDIALRYLMKQKGLVAKTQGGDIEIFNISGGDQIVAFAKNQVDGIWTVEPWVSRLVSEADGKILFEEAELWPTGRYATTVLIVRKRFLDEHPDLVAQWVQAHVDILGWMNEHPSEAKEVFNAELERETGKPLPPLYVGQSFARVTFSSEPMQAEILEAAHRASAIGLLGRNPLDLRDLFELSFLTSATQMSQEDVTPSPLPGRQAGSALLREEGWGEGK